MCVLLDLRTFRCAYFSMCIHLPACLTSIYMMLYCWQLNRPLLSFQYILVTNSHSNSTYKPHKTTHSPVHVRSLYRLSITPACHLANRTSLHHSPTAVGSRFFSKAQVRSRCVAKQALKSSLFMFDNECVFVLLLWLQ